MSALYDEIGRTYSATRRTDARIAEQLYAELEGAQRIVNIGAGAGSYEPEDAPLVAVEPSATMVAQRPAGSHQVAMAYAERLPFAADSFSHAMTVLSMHHWENQSLAYTEINRVATERFVAITWDPNSEPFWLTRDYFPEIHEADRRIFPDLDELNEHFDDVQMMPLMIPDDCRDGFFAAFWKRPEAYLSSSVRSAMSPFATIGDGSTGLRRLADDFASGAWARNNQGILGLSHIDAGYRIVVARVRAG